MNCTKRIRWITHATSGVALVIGLNWPGLAQRGGNGLGHMPAGVTGTVHGTVNQTLPPGKSDAVRPRTPEPGVGPSNGAARGVVQNASLSLRLQPFLPTGTSVAEAANGFENEGQFVATVHAAHNLQIPFDQLKAQVTGADQQSLGNALQTLRPTLGNESVKRNVKLAERQAQRDIQQAKSAGKPDKVATRIASNTALAQRLQTMLPPGTTLETAATGFKNEGQFIAALEVSKNLGIPFSDLKDRVTAGQSLGEGIRDLRPNMSETDVDATVDASEENAKSIQLEASAHGKIDTK